MCWFVVFLLFPQRSKSLLQARQARQENALHLRYMADSLRNTLSIMFAAGQLCVERVTWRTGADVLEKIGTYEAVHPIATWTDLRSRLGHRRRVFMFTHAAMPREPIVILHVALCPRIEHSIQNLIDDRNGSATGIGDAKEKRDAGDTPAPTELASDINTAVFYSITSAQPGLLGIDLGNQLIKRVVNELRREVPQVYKFCTLSPMKGFAPWLNQLLSNSSKSA